MKKHLFLSAFLFLILVLFTASAAPGDNNSETTPPVTAKTLESNGDGTYTLSLSVKDHVESSSESSKADVIVVLDTSGSMKDSVEDYVANQTGRYGFVDGNYVNLYYLNSGRYTRLTNDIYDGQVFYQTGSTWQHTYTEYTGTRYIQQQTNRLAVAKSAISNLADQLGSYNNEENPEAVRLALITFATNAKTETFSQYNNWTTDATTFKNTLNSNTIKAEGGTNWEEALTYANDLEVREDADVHVLFVSDGNPTYYVGGGTGRETSDNITLCYNKAKDEAQTIVSEGKHFYGIGAFGSVDRMVNLVNDSGAPSSNYYSAADSAGLQTAFANIISEITKDLGYKNVKITDGLTSMTSALVKTDPTSFTYTKNGSPWIPEDEQKAKYEDGNVSWDLGDMSLENGVTYTVSFKVWPSQEAYDLVADLNNGITQYNNLPVDVKEQFVKLENGYALKTNTNAEINYTQVETKETTIKPKGFVEGEPADDGYTYTYDSETGIYTGTKETPGSTDFINPDPIELTSSQITVEKIWEDDVLGDVRPDSLTLNVMKDNEFYKTLELNKYNGWKSTVYVAPGLIVNNETLETGHTYTITEPDIDVHYELDAKNFNPMIVNGVLIADYHTEATEANATVQVTNTRKGDLAISKTVETYDGGTVDMNKEFEMKVSFNKDNETWTPTEDDQVTYKIGDGPVQTFPSNGIIKLKHNETATISNLPIGITYTVEEQNLPTGYTQKSPAGAATGTIVGNSTQLAPFINKYEPEPSYIELFASKTLVKEEPATSPPDISGKYNLILDGGNVSPMPEGAVDGKVTKQNPDGDGKKVSFGEIKYIRPGIYSYYVHEYGTVSGVTNGQDTYCIVVSVEDNNGTLTAEMSFGSKVTEFTNTYSVSPAVLENGDISVNKILHKKDLVAGEFNFNIEALDDTPNAPLPEVTTATNDANGNVAFGKITYDNPGTYKYKISEVDDSASRPYYTYDAHEVYVTVNVSDNSQGQLVASVEYEGNTSFDNTYKASGSINITAKKNLKGRTLKNNQFKFKLTPIEGAPGEEQIKTNNASGQILFDEIDFSNTDLTIKEQVEKSYKLRYVNVEDENDVLEVIPEGTNLNENGGFTLKSDTGSVKIYKEQYVNIEDKNDVFYVLPEEAVYNGEGIFTITETKVTETSEKEFTYEITELNDGQRGYTYDTHTETVTVKVKDKGDGTFEVTTHYNNPNGAIFKNSYEASGFAFLKSTKSVIGADLRAKQFSFKLIDKDNNILSTVQNDANGDITFDALKYTEKDAGNTFTYSIVEVNDGQGGYIYDSNVYKAFVKVIDSGDGNLNTDVTYEKDPAFVNTYKPLSTEVVLTAKKILTGRTLVDGEFSFTISDGNTELATGKNDANGNITFSAIPITEAGTYKFTVAEVIGNMEGVTYDNTTYTYVVVVKDVDGELKVIDVSIEGANEAVFNNTYKPIPQPDNPDNPDTPDNPKTPDSTKTYDTPGIHKTLNTGDNANFIIWLSLMCLSATGFTSVILFGKRKRSYKYARK